MFAVMAELPLPAALAGVSASIGMSTLAVQPLVPYEATLSDLPRSAATTLLPMLYVSEFIELVMPTTS